VEESDDELVRRTLRGDLTAFEELVTRHGPVVHRLATRIVGPDDADDVSQDALLRAFHRLERYRGQGAFRAWLLQIAHNTAISALRRRREPAEDAAVLDERPSEDRLPADRLELRERLERLEGKLALLRPEHRAVIVLRDVEGLSYDEVARVTATPLGSVKARLHRARGELIDLLRANTYDWELPR
jgi:RNA polymerase sigma-70 factor, ECF subfamily